MRTPCFGQDCWSSRELGRLLGYLEYRNFEPVLKKAIESCINSENNYLDHFVDKHEMIPLGKGGQRAIDLFEVSRYGAYLVIQNADPAKPLVAAGQTYFAIQTRRQELSDQEKDQAFEDQQRLVIRSEMRDHNLKLVDTARTLDDREGQDD
jgi:DNA-damage-inducible protein D